MAKKFLSFIWRIVKWILVRICIIIGLCLGVSIWGYFYTKKHPTKPTNQRNKRFFYFDSPYLKGKKSKWYRKPKP